MHPHLQYLNFTEKTIAMNTEELLLNKQKAYFKTGITKSLAWRIEQLERIEKMLTENQDKFMESLSADFKTALPEQLFEIYAPLGVIQFTKSQLSSWMEPSVVPIPKFLAASGHQGAIYREPYGVTLILAPFNFPLLGLLNPAIAALSAGNTVILKANEQASATSTLLTALVPQYFETEAVAIIHGGPETVTALLELPFDFIFFTGSTRVGKIVAKAAAAHLTPVILELGGQNPAIVDETADVASAARKLTWGATAWAGQWCTSPGYVYVHESIAEAFIQESKKALKEMYGDDAQQSADYSSIISPAAVNRLASLIDPEKVVAGGRHDAASRYLEPTILYPVNWSDRIMEEEIFGPILPVLVYKDLEETVREIQEKPKPLAAFIFSKNQQNIDYFTNTLSFGGGAVNQTNVHLFIVTLPFGGVGASGIGNYYGKAGYDSLTHAKSMLIAPAESDIDHLIPPYTLEKVQALGNWFDY